MYILPFCFLFLFSCFFNFLVLFHEGGKGLPHDVVIFLLPNRPFWGCRTPSLITDMVNSLVILVGFTLNPRIADASIVSCLMSFIPGTATKVVSVYHPPLGSIKKPPFRLQIVTFLSRLLSNLLTHLIIFVSLTLIHLVLVVLSVQILVGNIFLQFSCLQILISTQEKK